MVHAPHPPLTDYYQNESQRHRWVRRIFDDTAADDDRVERFVGLGSGSRYRGAALLRAGLRPGMKVLDVGVGTGLVSRQIADLSIAFAECARVLRPWFARQPALH